MPSHAYVVSPPISAYTYAISVRTFGNKGFTYGTTDEIDRQLGRGEKTTERKYGHEPSPGHLWVLIDVFARLLHVRIQARHIRTSRTSQLVVRFFFGRGAIMFVGSDLILGFSFGVCHYSCA